MPRISSLGTIGGMGMGLGRKLPIQAIQAILSSNANDFYISSLFTSEEWSSSVKKQVVINSGVTIGQQAADGAALVADAGFGGELEIINNGSVIGRAGAGADVNGVGGNGGNAFEAQQSGITLINNGAIYAGGGGGGSGGQGGQGQYGYYQETYYTYQRLCYRCWSPYPDYYCQYYGYPFVNCQTQSTQTIYVAGTAGGYGGSGGYGAGVVSGQVYTSGQTGASGQASDPPSPAGAGRGGQGGAGGAGGDYGQAGSAGSQGVVGGNVSAAYTPQGVPGTGSVGFAGGAPGTAIVNSGNVTVINNGTIL